MKTGSRLRHEELDWRLGLVLAFENDLLCIRDDEIEAGPIEDVEGHAGFVQKMEGDVGIKPVHIFGRNDTRLIEALNFTQRLEDGRVWCEDQCIVAVFGIFRELVGEYELIEDAGGHEDGFTCPHGQREDVVGIGAGIGLHLTIDQLK